MAIEKIQETKLFSAHESDAAWLNSLRQSSVSDQDAAMRKSEYAKLFSKYERLKEAYKMFSGVTEMPLLSNQYFNATVASFVRSFAGYLTIERDMAEPTALLWYDDVLGVVDDKMILPNVGPEDLSDVDTAVFIDEQTIAQAAITLSVGNIIVPGSIKMQLVSQDGNTTATVVDDGKGNLLAPAGILTAGSVTYLTGAVTLTVANSFVNGTYSFRAAKDEPGIPSGNSSYSTTASEKNRFKLDMKNILVASHADLLIGESNLVAMAQANKSLNQNPMQVLGAKLVELYTKLINSQIVGETKRAATGNAYVIDASDWDTRFYDYNSRLNAFSAELVSVDTELAVQSVKGVEATAYVCDAKAGNWFRKMRATGEFREEKGSTYVNDLLGYYHDIPVLRHTDVEANTFYAIHKTPGGELAPVMLGQYLPLTWTPNIGSYQNPTQVANGVFYQLGVRAISSELVKKVTIQETATTTTTTSE